MNGQMYQACSIVAACKKAVQTNADIIYAPAAYEHALTFTFLPERKFFKTKRYTAPDVKSWFSHIKDQGLQDIKFLCPIRVKDKHVLGFSNTSESMIVCFFKDGKVTYFTADWQFDTVNRYWNISYTEYNWDAASAWDKPHFEDNTASFKQILHKIQQLALRIECEGFAHTFEAAWKLLEGVGEYPDRTYGLGLPQLPMDKLQIFEAASLADVFGAMGSWNDSPPYMAQEKGLYEEYEKLSDELLEHIRLAILYAVNEW